LGNYAAQNGTNKNAVVEELLYALREKRIFTVPRSGPNPFPASGEIEPGASPEYPILVAPGIPPKEPAKGWSVFQVEGIGIGNPQAIRRDPEGNTVLVSPGDQGNKPPTKDPEKP
jgi:hypothetical protein